jgi:hypothetical protein
MSLLSLLSGPDLFSENFVFKQRVSQGVEVYPTNCRMTNVIEGKMEGRVGRGRRRKQPLADIQEKREYWKLNEEALYLTPWKTCFKIGCGPVVRQTTESVNEQINFFFCFVASTQRGSWPPHS